MCLVVLLAHHREKCSSTLKRYDQLWHGFAVCPAITLNDMISIRLRIFKVLSAAFRSVLHA